VWSFTGQRERWNFTVEKDRSSTSFDNFEEFFESLKANTVCDTGGEDARVRIDCIPGSLIANLGPKDHPEPSTSSSTKSVDSYEGSIRSLILPLLFNSTEPWDASKLREYANVGQLKKTLHTLQYTPLIDPHRVGILYVAPGQNARRRNPLEHTRLTHLCAFPLPPHTSSRSRLGRGASACQGFRTENFTDNTPARGWTTSRRLISM
jgi:hypothetical protein